MYPSIHSSIHPSTTATNPSTPSCTHQTSIAPPFSSTQLPTYPSIHSSIYPPLYRHNHPLTIHSSIPTTNQPITNRTKHSSIHPTIQSPSLQPTIHSSTHPSILPSIQPSIHPYIQSTNHTSIQPPTHPTTHPIIYPYTRPSYKSIHNYVHTQHSMYEYT